MSATYVFSFAKKFATNCSQSTDEITPKECLFANPHLFIYPFADYVIMLTSLLSSVDCAWTVLRKHRKALFNENNFSWIIVAIGIAATASVVSYTIDVLQRTKEQIQICCLNNLMTSKLFIFRYNVVSVLVGLTSVALLILSVAGYAICHSQTLHAIGGITLVKNRAGDWVFQSIWLITISSYIMFAVYKFAKDDVLQRKIRVICRSCTSGNSVVQEPTTTPTAKTTKFGKTATNFSGSKIGVLLTLPYVFSSYYVVQFMTFMYSSWKFVQERSFEVTFPVVPLEEKLNLVDLLVFCEPRTCPLLPADCLTKMDIVKTDQPRRPTCYYQPTRQFNHNYSNINAYAFVNERNFKEVVPYYDYFLRTDIDAFLSPTILNFQMPKNLTIITGNGGYCTKFSTARLRKIAERLGLKHKGVHCTGSTWFGESNLIAKLAPIAANLTMYIFDNEFDTKKYPELKAYFSESKHGTWPHWWKPVSSMYAQELVLNDQIENLTENNKKGDLLDVESCRTTRIVEHLHVHAWHAYCDFSKFKFLDPLVMSLQANGPVSISTEDLKLKLTNCLSVSNYCNHIASRGLVRSLERLARHYQLMTS
ncbi:hypothetical protein TTRE_0000269201 [Trichuris trichiura]|uniref:DUF7164 domain-containing protein n=1 Tax=Trichuris trichiura TaxID=36087 RepID=A0A077Z1Q2_TRITR|nr:hypothetical protein TTRE_0000269201 [Trichuris trichiura]